MAANNGAIPNPVYQPAMRVITNISNANPCVITTSFANNYFDTDIVTLYIDKAWGDFSQLNEMVGQIKPITSTTFYFPADTTLLGTFTDPNNGQFAQVIATSENVNTVYGATVNTLPSLIRPNS